MNKSIICILFQLYNIILRLFESELPADEPAYVKQNVMVF